MGEKLTDDALKQAIGNIVLQQAMSPAALENTNQISTPAPTTGPAPV